MKQSDMSGPSERAIEAANATVNLSFDHQPPIKYLKAAHDPALGLDRSVCLRDVVEALRHKGETSWAEHYMLDADFIERKFGREA